MRTLPIFFLLIASAVAETGDKARSLTLADARSIALEKHPKISVAELKSLASQQTVKQSHSAFLPFVLGNAGTAVAASDNTRIVSPSLPVSSVFDRASASVNLSQLITDFGRSASLEQSAQFKAGADEQNIAATRAQIWLQVDGAYVGALQAAALLEVAEDTVKTRTLLRDQIATLAKNQLKSELDASFAEVNLQDAQLLLSKSQSDLQSAHATLAALLDEPRAKSYRLAGAPSPAALPGDVSALIESALEARPDLARLRLERDAAHAFASAEHKLNRPTLSIQGAAGVIPWHDKDLNENYAAAGLVLSWPLSTGGLNAARRKEAELKAKSADAALRDEENNVTRDVRLAWLNAKNAQERQGIAAKLLEQAKKTLSLAQAKYDAGSSSIVELSQSQLNATTVEITATTARYEYLLRRSMLDYATGKMK
ncbi:MAG: TolC family protein [Verrucomicrobiaceae bacterium]|nr:TolC family protein [Verrucomicrobiaceae bacterium]